MWRDEMLTLTRMAFGNWIRLTATDTWRLELDPAVTASESDRWTMNGI